jgi:hypothetical protein
LLDPPRFPKETPALSARPSRAALQRLDTKWDNLFDYRDDGGAAKQDEEAAAAAAARQVRYQTVEAGANTRPLLGST